MRILIYCLLAMLCLVASAFAQVTPPVNIRPLTIGDTMPDITLTNVYNYPVSKIHLSDLKGKLVILDFWATWCGSCIKEIPKMEELQKKFKDRVQIIMVNSDTSETESKISGFLQKRKERTGQPFTLTYALQNAVLTEYFPHQEVPHYIWLTKSGKVAGISNAEDITEENIIAFLQNNNKTLLTKRDELHFNPGKPLLIDENGGNNPADFIYRSIFTEYKEYLGGAIGQVKSPGEGTTRYYVINSNILGFLKFAYYDVLKNYSTERIIVAAAKYNSRTILDTAINKRRENRYCYEIITTPISQHELIEYMRQDIYRTFRLISKNEIREMDCYVLQAGDNTKSIKTKGEHPSTDMEPSSIKKYIRNRPAQSLTDILQPLLNRPVLNEVILDFNIDMSFPSNFQQYSYAEIKQYLQQNGLLLIPAKRKIEVAVITDQLN